MTALYKNFCDSNTSECLDIVCQYLRDNKTDELQEEWLAITSMLGLHVGMHSKAWIDINTELLNLLEAPGIKVSLALILTSKMCLLHRRCVSTHEITKMPKNLKDIRKDILKLIPEQSKLAFSGIQLFGKMLPQPDDETFSFYSRVLAGLSKIADDVNLDDLSKCLEYFSRKKLQLPVEYPTPVIAPNKTDPDWFLWGFLLIYYSTDKNVATNFKLYSWNNGIWQKNYKTQRQGLLWGTPYVISTVNQIEITWTREELHILEQIRIMAPQLWKTSSKIPKVYEFTPTKFNNQKEDDYDEEEHEVEEKVLKIDLTKKSK